MTVLLATQQVQDFSAWKERFDAMEKVRRGHGVRAARVYRNIDDPHDVVIILEWDSADRAHGFFQESGLGDEQGHHAPGAAHAVYFLNSG